MSRLAFWTVLVAIAVALIYEITRPVPAVPLVLVLIVGALACLWQLLAGVDLLGPEDEGEPADVLEFRAR